MAAGIFGFTPDLILLNGMLLAETLFVACLVCALYASLQALETGKASLVSSLWWGVAALVRPTALVFAMVYAVYTYVTKRRILSVLAVLLFPIVLLGAWSLRNSLLYHQPLFTTTAGAYALWVGNNQNATGGFDKTPEIQGVRDKYHSVELSKIAMRKYTEFIWEEPLQFTVLQIKKTSMYFSLVRPTGFWFFLAERPVQRLVILMTSSLATGFLFIIGGAGMYLYMLRREKHYWFLIFSALFQPFTVIPLYVETRYRAPFFLFLALFAAYALYSLWHAQQKTPALYMRALIFSGIVILVLTLGDGLYSYDIIVERLKILLSQFTFL